mmetsp:Transcript_27503/g.47465  ORF Transcript_27503/g.47465 Transcript_27503/m.47465 type:complete len:255 (-) Transcript_27503:1133-1897(-)
MTAFSYLTRRFTRGFLRSLRRCGVSPRLDRICCPALRFPSAESSNEGTKGLSLRVSATSCLAFLDALRCCWTCSYSESSDMLSSPESRCCESANDSCCLALRLSVRSRSSSMSLYGTSASPDTTFPSRFRFARELRSSFAACLLRSSARSSSGSPSAAKSPKSSKSAKGSVCCLSRRLALSFLLMARRMKLSSSNRSRSSSSRSRSSSRTLGPSAPISSGRSLNSSRRPFTRELFESFCRSFSRSRFFFSTAAG